MNLGNYINTNMVDSRFNFFNSTSNTDFKIELPDNLQMPPYTGCVITDVVIPRTFYNVNKKQTTNYILELNYKTQITMII